MASVIARMPCSNVGILMCHVSLIVFFLSFYVASKVGTVGGEAWTVPEKA